MRPTPSAHRWLAATFVALSLGLAACSGLHNTVANNLPGTQGRSVAPQALPTLGAYNINASKVFIAGISSGGLMDVQMHFAYSGTYKGSATYAGGPDWCANDSETTALLDCGGDGVYGSELTPSENYINSNQNTAGMDPVSNISGQPVYLWSGTDDTVVPQKTMNDLATEYAHYGATVTYNNTTAAQHGWESLDGTVACDTASATSPYMIDCNNYDSEKTWLTLFLGTLNARNGGTLGGTLINFDQTEYGGGSNSLDTDGYLYVPANCASGTQCSLVVALDGCLQYLGAIGDKFATLAGINEYADTNNIVVLYPYQTDSSSSNPNGCWDWWGYVNSSYALKSGPQMSFIYNMTKHLMSGGGATPTPSPTPTKTPTPTPTPTGGGPTPTPSPTPTKTPTPGPTPTKTPTPTPTPTSTSLGCWTTPNYYQISAGRATLQNTSGDALANGSNQNMGLDNTYTTVSLEETSSNYYIIVSHC